MAIDPIFLEYDVERVELERKVHGSGGILYIVKVKRDFPRQNWLIGETVTLDNNGEIIVGVVTYVEFDEPAGRIYQPGVDEIGLRIRQI